MATTASQTPTVPPRPSRSQDTPKIPPRPARRGGDRSVSPSRDRFAPSPLNEANFLSKTSGGHGSSYLSVEDPIDRPASVDLPSLGQEGIEYAAVAEELKVPTSTNSGTSSPENTRTVGADLKLHAPKPSLPASSAKERVATVTRTDSDKAASFGIGRPSSEDASLSQGQRKKSTTSQESSTEELGEEEQGIPEIGVQVPMYPNAGDVQAPSPGQPVERKSKHGRKTSHLPPDSYGLHGHGVIPSDKLEQAYYGKHPELAKKEHHQHHSDRAKDFSRTSDELNKIVRETANHGTGIATHDINGTPSEQIGWQAIEESISRPASAAPPKDQSNSFSSQTSAAASVLKKTTQPEASLAAPDDDIIHVEDPRRKSVMFDDESATLEADEADEAPILAADEVAKDPSPYEHEPAVEPTLHRRNSSFGAESSSRRSSRPPSRPTSIVIKDTDEDAVEEEEYEPLFKDDSKAAKPKTHSAEEHKNRFPSRDIWEDAPSSALYTAEVSTPDVPTEAETEPKKKTVDDFAPREGETVAQAFARRQEALAEKELEGDNVLSENRQPQKTANSSWLSNQTFPAATATNPALSAIRNSNNQRPGMTQRFPSRDVWEDAPDSLQLETEVSQPQEEETPSPAEATKPEVPHRPVRKLTDPAEKAHPHPVVPARPKHHKVAAATAGAAAAAAGVTAAVAAATTAASAGDSHSKPTIPERPKPHVPARPTRSHPTSASPDKEIESKAESASASASTSSAPVPKPKPAVPARPVGSKIAQLQATFMSDLNKKLRIGPQAPKKEEPEAAPAEAKETQKAPLSDARKGRARGPQRRAPTAAATAATAGAAAGAVADAAGAAAAGKAAPVSLGFSSTTTLFSIDPEEGVLSVSESDVVEVEVPTKAVEEEPTKTETPVEEVAKKAEEPEVVSAKAETPSSEEAKESEPEPVKAKETKEAKADVEEEVEEEEPAKKEEVEEKAVEKEEVVEKVEKVEKADKVEVEAKQAKAETEESSTGVKTDEEDATKDE